MKRLHWSADRITLIHEVLFSLNIALVLMAFVFQYGPRFFVSALNGLELLINRFLRIPQSDFIMGYWEFFLPGVLVAFFIGLLLRVSSGTPVTQAILRFAAGITAVILPPAWFCATYLRAYGWSPFLAIQVCELAAAISCVFLYFYGKWPVSRVGSLAVLIIHYMFWFWQFRLFFVTLFRTWGGAVAVTPVVGFCSSLIWMLYLSNVDSKPVTRAEVSEPHPIPPALNSQ